MSWPFLAVFFSGWLFVDAAYRGPHWQRWVFKPLTLLLLLLLASQAPRLGVTGYLIVFGLLATLLGDLLLLLTRERILYAIVAFFASHLLYSIGFTSQIGFSFYWPLPLTLAIVGGVLLAAIWSKLGKLRWPITAWVVMTLIMVWRAGAHYLLIRSEVGFSLLIGSLLLLVANSVWLLHRYRFKFRAADAVMAFCYFTGHFLVVRSLYF
ncbi:lysoplasmalogenase [Serratia microhaemolytica]|uniref:lysoplasmalogenase n=1 Tax=Serratia microhaemolytica TaxID=2675110 RepID=UPI000FDE142F|nr:lysoplasmalogenase [Serratia microhaemolytica]